MLNRIKKALNYNPIFSDTDIVDEIKGALEYIEKRTDAGKRIYTIQCTGDLYYDLSALGNTYKIINVYYGQNELTTTNQINEGFIKLEKIDMKDVNVVKYGYWIDKQQINNSQNDFVKVLKLNFTPSTNYYLNIIYVKWDNLDESIFNTDTDLDTYIEPEMQSLIIDRVIFILKRIDRDELYQDYKQDMLEAIDDLDSINKEDIKFI